MNERTLFLLVLAGLAAGCGERQACPEDSGAVPDCAEGYLDDRGQCVPDSCGTGTWGSLEVDGSTVYVDIATAEGGDGSEGAPLRSIQAGLDLAGSRGGGMVAVAAGTYSETLEFTSDHAGVHLAGRCRELVTLDASGGEEETPGVDVDTKYGEAELSGVSVVGARYSGVRVSTGQVRLAGLRVESSEFVGVAAYRGTSTGAPSVLVVEGCEIVSNSTVGVLAADSGTEVTLMDTVVRESVSGADRVTGYGIQVSGGAALRAEGCELVGNQDVGIVAADPGSEVTLVDTAIRDTQLSWDEPLSSYGVGGYGITVANGAVLWAVGCELTRNHTAGIVLNNPGTEADLVSTVVEGTRPDMAREGGRGIDVLDGASLWAQDCEVVGNTVAGIAAQGTETMVELFGSVIRNTRPYWDGDLGYGVQVGIGAGLWIDDCEFDNNSNMAILADGVGTRVVLRDSTIRGTTCGRGPLGAVSTGLTAQSGASVSASGLHAESNEGPGLHVTRGASLSCTDCTLLGNAFAGAVAVNGGQLELEGSTISGTQESIDLGGGVGVFAAEQSGWASPSLQVTDSAISDNPVAGVWLAGAGSYQLDRVTITDGSGVPHGPTTRCGDGVFAAGTTAWDGSTGLSIQDSTLSGHHGAGVFLDDAATVLGRNAWSENDPDLLVQGDTCLSPHDDWTDAPDREICPAFDRPTCLPEFRLNIAIAEPELAMVPLPSLPGPVRFPR